MLTKCRHRRFENKQVGKAREGYSHCPGGLLILVADDFQRLFQCLHRRGGLLQQLLPGFRQLDTPGSAHKKGVANMLLQQPERIADRRRRDFELARSGRDIALARNALKDAYLIIKRVIHSISLRHPRLIIKYRLNILKSMTA